MGFAKVYIPLIIFSYNKYNTLCILFFIFTVYLLLHPLYIGLSNSFQRNRLPKIWPNDSFCIHFVEPRTFFNSPVLSILLASNSDRRFFHLPFSQNHSQCISITMNKAIFRMYNPGPKITCAGLSPPISHVRTNKITYNIFLLQKHLYISHYCRSSDMLSYLIPTTSFLHFQCISVAKRFPTYFILI